MLGTCPGGGDFRGAPGGGAPVEGFTLINDVVEGADGFFDWGVAIGTVGIAIVVLIAM